MNCFSSVLVVTVGFDPVTYFVNEVDGFAELSVVLLEGELERDITVQFSTSSGSATEEGTSFIN